MLVTRQIPSLFNGVSQQPPPVRSSSQWEDQVNVVSSVVDGIRKRSPCEHIAKISSSRFPTAHLHTINRDINERYHVVISRTGIRVFDKNGVERTVTAPLGWGYLSLPTTAQGRYAFTAVTVADYTFIVNKTKTVAMLPAGADRDPPSDDYWWLNRPANYGPSPSLNPIANLFIQQEPDRDPYGGGGTSSTSNPTPAAPQAGNPASTFKGQKQTLQDLPATGNAIGDLWKIVGTDQSNFQSYYVRWSGATWDETVLPGLRNLVDATTMPHALIRQGDGTFIFGPFAWSPRRVGDENTNPNPTFVGRTIRDVFFFDNRLGLCVDENVVLSRAGDFGNYYRLTVVDYLPDDVIDIAASETKVTKMEFAVPFQGAMMLFSDQTQFRLDHSAGVLSGQTVSLQVSTEYPTIAGVRPAKSGADVYFASQGSGWGQLREYFVDKDNLTHDAADVSSHVPNYLPASIHCIAASAEYDTVCLLADDTPNRVYVYRYYWANQQQKAQSAWNYWTVDEGAKILSASVLGGYLVLLIDREDGTYLERIALFYGSGVANLPFQVYLDRRCQVQGTYDHATNTTSFVTPYEVPLEARGAFRLVFGNPSTGADIVHFTDEQSNLLTDEMGNLLTDGGVVPGNGGSRAATQLTWSDNTHFTVTGDHSQYPCAFGRPYTMRAVFSRQYPQNLRGEPVHTGRLQLKTFSLYHTDTAYFRVEVRPYGPGSDPMFTTEFPIRRMNVDGMGEIGKPVFADGKVTFAVQANAAEAEIAIVNDSHLGCCINAAEWEGFYYNRAGGRA